MAERELCLLINAEEKNALIKIDRRRQKRLKGLGYENERKKIKGGLNREINELETKG